MSVVKRAPFVPSGSFTTCTTISCPSRTNSEILLTLNCFCSFSSTHSVWDTMSAACKKAAFSKPISTKADCIPGSTRVTRPL